MKKRCDKEVNLIKLGEMVVELIAVRIKDQKNMFGIINEEQLKMILARGCHFPKPLWCPIINILLDLGVIKNATEGVYRFGMREFR